MERDHTPDHTELERPDDLLALAGTRLGTSPWIEITQQDVDDFARVTRDEQWIHVDRERAAAGPFGRTIVHGYYVLSLCAHFTSAAYTIKNRLGPSINYGLDRFASYPRSLSAAGFALTSISTPQNGSLAGYR